MDSLQLFRAMQDSLSVPLDATWKKTATATLDDLAPAAYFPASQVLIRRPSYFASCKMTHIIFQTAFPTIIVSLSRAWR